MKNLDVLQQQKAEIANKMNQAMKDNNEEAFASAFEEYTNILQEAVLAEAKGLVQSADNTILAGRGVRVLTSEERQYYEKTIEAMKSSSPKQALSGYDNVLPKTVIDAVFEDITESHPLLSEIKFENASALLEYLYSSMNGRFKAVWGKLCSTITEQLGAQFQKLSFGQTKLSAFLPVCKAMLDLGPAWLDRYVRTILFEAIANGLEDGTINGRGVAEGNPNATIYEPIGMIKDLDNYNVALGYADKNAIPISDFSPENYGGLISQLAVGPNLLNRAVTEVLLVVNPVDYLTKIFPATVYQTPQGGYVKDIFPFPTKVVQSAYMTQGKAAIGISKRYLAVLGTGKDGRIEYSDEYKFLEDERYYLIKLYGTGRPLDNTSFLYLDISNIRPVHPIVRVSDYVDARLSAIGMTDELTADVDLGTFSENIHYYAGAVEDTSAGNNNAAVLEVTAKDSNAVITVELNGTSVVAGDSGYATTLTAGQNVIIISSAVGAVVETYVLVITYTPIT
jgi:hypothetical protein